MRSHEISGGYVVKVNIGGRNWEYYKGVTLDDVIETTPEFYGAFRFHDYWTACRVKECIEDLGKWAIIKQLK